MISKSDWISFFPFPQVRKEQETIIDFILNSFYVDGKLTTVIEAGLGIGKSAIAATVANYIALNSYGLDDDEDFDNGTYILTSQKILQQQYINDFAKPPTALKNLVSSANFACTGRPGAKCSDSMRVYAALKERYPPAPREHCRKHCAYKKQKADFMQALTGVTNYSYFMSETMYAGQLKPRRLLVVDECHSIEKNISAFVELRITQRFAETVLKVKFSPEKDPQKFMAWLGKKYEPALAKYIKKLVDDIEQMKDEVKVLDLSEKLEMMDKHICKVHRLQKTWDPKNWIVSRETIDGVPPYDAVTFKPIEVSAWTSDMMLKFGQKQLLMSATILDRDFYMKSLGLDPSKTAFISIDSPFETKNKPIFYIPVGKMSYNDIDASLPKVISMVEELLKAHPNEKGLCHATNFRVAEALGSIKNPRLLIQAKGVARDDLLRKHIESSEPTVLVSPSMVEGVDLKDDLSRFQIFCKIPFPSLADEVIKKKAERDKRYYPYVTAQAIIQATGRSVRNERDWAVTYILDECATDFFRRNRRLFPRSFLDSFVDLEGNMICK